VIDFKIMCSGFLSTAALAPVKHPVGEFLNDRMHYKFLQSTRTGLHLDSCLVSVNDR
jgi:hypothetical protein